MSFYNPPKLDQSVKAVRASLEAHADLVAGHGDTLKSDRKEAEDRHDSVMTCQEETQEALSALATSDKSIVGSLRRAQLMLGGLLLIEVARLCFGR